MVIGRRDQDVYGCNAWMVGERLVGTSKVRRLAWSKADTGCVLTEVKDQGRKRLVKLTEYKSLN